MNTNCIVYSDFACPFCYAQNERLLAAGLAGRVGWRGVQHAPHLPIPMANASPRLGNELNHEVASIQRLAPEIPIALPRGKPNARPAIMAVARAMKFAASTGNEFHQFKDSLYRALWREGLDISDPVILNKLASAAGLPEEIMHLDVTTTVSNWQGQWESSGLGSVPALIDDRGRVLAGLASTQALQDFVNIRRQG